MFSITVNGRKHVVRYPYAPLVHAWTLRGLFRLTKYYDSIRALMLPLVDLTLQVEFKVLDTLIGLDPGLVALSDNKATYPCYVSTASLTRFRSESSTLFHQTPK